MIRIKSFDAPHKGLRNVLGQFSLLAGQTDYGNPEQVATLKTLGHEMFTLLNDHVHTENEFTLKHLEERVKGASVHDLHDHEVLEKEQDVLQDSLNTLNGKQSADEGHRFYLAFSKYHSRYLEHIHEEETVTELLLQQNFTDEELIQHRVEIMQRIQFPILLLWLKYTIPAQSEENRVGMLSAFKANAPKEAFDAVLATIKPVMKEEDYASLIKKL